MSSESNVAIAAEENPSAKVKKGAHKKPASAKKESAKKIVEHPPYNEMIRQALVALKERGGSSRQAILKYVMANFKVGGDEHSVNTHLKVALRNGVKSELLKQSKGSGASGSFRLGADAKKNVAVAREKVVKKKESGSDSAAVAKSKLSKAKAAVAAKKRTPVTKKVASAKKQIKKQAVAEKTSSIKKSVKPPKPAAKKAVSPKKPIAVSKKSAAAVAKKSVAAMPKKDKAASDKKKIVASTKSKVSKKKVVA